MTLTKGQLLGLSKIHDGLFPVPYRPGEPCNHPGCADHLSRPCENCGRYAAGLQNGPDIAAGRSFIYEMARDDPVIQSIYRCQEEYGWSWEQVMIAIIIKQGELIENSERRFHEAIINRTS